MRGDKVGDIGDKRGAAASARLVIHPAADAAATGLMSAMAVEFDRWMADEVEELAESIAVAAGSTGSEHVRTYLRQMADQLARQAELLGYPDVVRAAARLGLLFDPEANDSATEPTPDRTEIDLRIAELRALLNR
jgi:hypothetical protein